MGCLWTMNSEPPTFDRRRAVSGRREGDRIVCTRVVVVLVLGEEAIERVRRKGDAEHRQGLDTALLLHDVTPHHLIPFVESYRAGISSCLQFRRSHHRARHRTVDAHLLHRVCSQCPAPKPIPFQSLVWKPQRYVLTPNAVFG